MRGKTMHATTIVGYTYRAEILCPPCTLEALPTGAGEAFDGWQDMSAPPMSVEDNLSEIAYALGIDRQDEYTFDSDEFPKVVFASQVEDDEPCDRCGAMLIEDW